MCFSVNRTFSGVSQEHWSNVAILRYGTIVQYSVFHVSCIISLVSFFQLEIIISNLLYYHLKNKDRSPKGRTIFRISNICLSRKKNCSTLKIS